MQEKFDSLIEVRRNKNSFGFNKQMLNKRMLSHLAGIT